jgi:hypothetical protein
MKRDAGFARWPEGQSKSLWFCIRRRLKKSNNKNPHKKQEDEKRKQLKP